MYSFEKCLELGSPARDEETKAARDEVIAMAQSEEGTFANIVPLYIKNINKKLILLAMYFFKENLIYFTNDI